MPPPAPLAPRPGVVPLRPLSLGEIYDGAFQAMRRNPGQMIGSAAVIGAFTAVATALWQLLSGPALLPLLDPATAGNISDDEALGALGAFGGGGLVAILVSLVAVAVLSGILVLPVSRAVTGQRAGFGEVWRAVWPRFWALLGVVLVVLAAVTGIVLLLVVPGVLAAVDLAFLLLYLAALPAAFLLGCWTQVVTTLALPAVMLERAGPVTALRRGWTLVGGMWTGAFWRSLGILLLAAIIVGVAQQLIALPAGLLSGALAFTDPGDPLTAAGFSPVQVLLTAIAGIVAAAVVYPFQAGVGTLLYVDHRMRREGLDVELARAASQ